MTRKALYLLMIIIVIGLAACQGGDTPDQSTPTDTSSAPLTTEESYPPPIVDQASSSDAYPGPAGQSKPSRTLTPYEFKESDPGFATIHGYLFVTDITLVQPDSNDAIFLAPLPEQGVSSIPTITVGEAPQADVDERTGEFVFNNVEPGSYAVVVMLKGGSQMPAYVMDEGKFVIVKVTEEQLDTTIEIEYIRIP